MLNLNAREMNRIIAIVNAGETLDQTAAWTEEELRFYQNLCEESQKVYERHGIRPVFALCELD